MEIPSQFYFKLCKTKNPIKSEYQFLYCPLIFFFLLLVNVIPLTLKYNIINYYNSVYGLGVLIEQKQFKIKLWKCVPIKLNKFCILFDT